MDRNGIVEYLKEDWTSVCELIRDSLKSDISLLNMTNESVLSHPGKRLRPMMALLMAKACGNVNMDSIRFAAASELLHNATLFHDDVVDGSTHRRGLPTVASVLSGSAAVLIGDYWLVKAMENIMNSDSQDFGIVRLFSKTLSDLAEGEMLQLQKSSSCDTSEADYYRIIYSKTASLFEAACVSAAKSVGADEKIIKAASDYAVAVGIAFQIQDDILDYSGRDLGKPTGMDLKEHKITLPLLGALHNASPEKEKIIRGMVAGIDENPSNIPAILDYVEKEGGVEYAAQKLHEYCAKAIEALSVLPRSQARTYLEELAIFVEKRDK